ncbi:MAG: NUDIX domain-containing protein [Clostridia bacterium]|nr:NUDIX domain-containing protein [Clostridia bacterium]
MDITYRTPDGTFNYRAAAIIVHENRLLVLQDEGIPHDYLPGGRVHVGEAVEEALRREVREELGIDLPPHRLVFVAESFFTLMGTNYHELGVYHLMDAPPELVSRGERFTRVEGSEVHHFRWVRFEELARLDFFPTFLKERILSLPDAPEFLTCPSDKPSPLGIKSAT